MRALRFLWLFCSVLTAAGPAASPARATILPIQQVAQQAFNAGFRGGSLVSAIAAAEAESGFDTEVVNNNLHQTTAAGQLIPGPNGRPVLLSLPRSARQMLPLDSIQPLGDGRFGRVVSHCRGLWQFNSKVHPDLPTDTIAFDPATAAACAWKISRHGRDWGKWVVMQNGTAWEPARLARARAAALARDFSVLTGNPNERAQARVTGGAIRQTPGGTRIRALHFGDTGRLLAGPVKAAITQGPQTSIKLWWQIQWDSGPTGWVSEDLLIRSFALDLQPASPAYDGAPHQVTGVKTDAALTWCTGANTTTQKLYLGRSAALAESDLQFTGLINAWTPPQPLLAYTTYYWRVDTISAQGTILPGPVWNFLTRPPEPAALTIQSVLTSPAVLQPGFSFMITCQTVSAAGQPVLFGTSLHRLNTNPITDAAYEVPRFAPAGSGSFFRNFALPPAAAPGNYTLLVRLAQDFNGNGLMDDFETIIAEHRQIISVAPAGPLVEALAVSRASMAPGQLATITATITALPGSSLTALRLFRAEGESAPGPYTLVNSRNMGNASTYTAVLTDQPPTIRRYWYALQASDNTGRSAPDGPWFRPVSVRVTINDTRPPVILWNNLEDGAVITGNPNFNGTFTDQDLIESASSRTDDGPWEALNPSSWLAYPAAGAGAHRLTLRVTDRSGNTTTESRSYYRPPQPGSPDFEEDQAFNGPFDHNPSWQLYLQGGAQITGGRLDAPDPGDLATFYRIKQIPPWAHAVEISWQCGVEGSSFTWDRNFFSPVLARIVPSGAGSWQLHVGDTTTYQSLPLAPFNPTTSPRLSVLFRLEGVRVYVRVVTADAAPRVLAESLQNLSNLASTPLQGTTFKTGGPEGGPGWLDDIAFCALRADQAFVCLPLTPLPPTSTERPFSLRWTTLPGRHYQVETMDPVTRLWTAYSSPVPATSLVTTRTLTFPRTRPAALVRARQLLP